MPEHGGSPLHARFQSQTGAKESQNGAKEMRAALTEIAIRNARPPERGTVALWDATVPGLCLRVSQGGTKSFSLVQGTERARTAIGRYPSILNRP